MEIGEGGPKRALVHMNRKPKFVEGGRGPGSGAKRVFQHHNTILGHAEKYPARELEVSMVVIVPGGLEQLVVLVGADIHVLERGPGCTRRGQPHHGAP